MTDTIKPSFAGHKQFKLTDEEFETLTHLFADLNQRLSAGDYVITEATKATNTPITMLTVKIEPSPAYGDGDISKMFFTFNDLVDAHNDRVALAELIRADAHIETKGGMIFKHRQNTTRLGDLGKLYYLAAVGGVAKVMEDYRVGRAEKVQLEKEKRAEEVQLELRALKL